MTQCNQYLQVKQENILCDHHSLHDGSIIWEWGMDLVVFVSFRGTSNDGGQIWKDGEMRRIGLHDVNSQRISKMFLKVFNKVVIENSSILLC